MLEALWSVHFSTPQGSFGSGIVVIDNGKILGGDASFLYVGWINVVEDTVTAKLEVRKYADVPGIHSIIGPDKFKLTLTGKKEAMSRSLLNG